MTGILAGPLEAGRDDAAPFRESLFLGVVIYKGVYVCFLCVVVCGYSAEAFEYGCLHQQCARGCMCVCVQAAVGADLDIGLACQAKIGNSSIPL